MFSIQKIALVLTMLALPLQNPDNLIHYAYTECKLGRFVIQESSERARPFIRSVPTANGDRQVEIVHGISLHIAYEGTPFVNFKAERLGNNYSDGKQVLIENLKYLNAEPDMEAGEPKRSSMNGFEVYGVNRKLLAGGVLSMYVLFRNVDQTAITLYILNTPPEAPKFHTMDQYRLLRDEFLKTYTACAGAASPSTGL